MWWNGSFRNYVKWFRDLMDRIYLILDRQLNTDASPGFGCTCKLTTCNIYLLLAIVPVRKHGTNKGSVILFFVWVTYNSIFSSLLNLLKLRSSTGKQSNIYTIFFKPNYATLQCLGLLSYLSRNSLMYIHHHFVSFGPLLSLSSLNLDMN